MEKRQPRKTKPPSSTRILSLAMCPLPFPAPPACVPCRIAHSSKIFSPAVFSAFIAASLRFKGRSHHLAPAPEPASPPYFRLLLPSISAFHFLLSALSAMSSPGFDRRVAFGRRAYPERPSPFFILHSAFCIPSDVGCWMFGLVALRPSVGLRICPTRRPINHPSSTIPQSRRDCII
jgi:hypothetical protein